MIRQLLPLDDVNLDKPDKDGQTLIFAPSMFGPSGVVRPLLARDDVNPDKPANNSKTSIPDHRCSSENPSSVKKAKLHLAATVAKSLSFDPSLILLAVIEYLLPLPLSTPKCKRRVLHHRARGRPIEPEGGAIDVKTSQNHSNEISG